MEREIRPPLGITPEWLWTEHRVVEIYDAIIRYSEAKKEFPLKLIVEKKKHLKYLERNERRYLEFMELLKKRYA